MYEDSEHRELYFEHRMSIEVSLYRDHEGAGSTPRIIEILFFFFSDAWFSLDTQPSLVRLASLTHYARPHDVSNSIPISYKSRDISGLYTY